MLPVPALIQSAAPAALPAWFPTFGGLELRPGSLECSEFDQEVMELRNPAGGALVRVPAEGRVWRFVVRGAGTRLGVLAMQERIREALAFGGWNLVWPERGIARLDAGGRDAWFRASVVGGGELRCVLVEKAPPPLILLPAPGPAPVMPKPQEDFPYLPAWPGAKLTASASSQAPVGVKFGEADERMLMVNWVDKEYQLQKPVSPHAFLTTYRAALVQAGWEIEGFQRGPILTLQAFYAKEDRDIRVTLRLFGDAMGISVADVGAQVRKGRP